MLVSPIMPTMALMSHKRNFSQLTSNSPDLNLPTTKRQCLNTDLLKDRLSQENDNKQSDRQTSVISIFPPYDVHPHLPSVEDMEEVRLSLIFQDCSPLCSHGFNPESSLVPQRGYNHYDHLQREPNIYIKATGDHDVAKPKKDGSVRYQETCIVENTPHSQTLTSDVDSDGSESGRTSISKSKMKQPSILLMRVSQPTKTDPASSNSIQVPSEKFNVVQGGYVHRMANLNARACVAAFLQPERKRSSESKVNMHRKTAKSITEVKRKTKSKSITTLNNPIHKMEHAKSKPTCLDVMCLENDFPSSVVRFEPHVVEIPTCMEIGAPHILDEHYKDISKVPYNKLGLLYNGDTIHPHARVFYTKSINRELQLPYRVVPTLVPSQISTVKKATRKNSLTGVRHPNRKTAKKNNGWHPLGEPIRVIQSHEGLSKRAMKYYAGIKRKEEEIYVRDCIVIKAGSDEDENPYVAKVGSIWQEPDGSLKMTAFWYYRASDSEVQNAGVECVKMELLASQHHDINSVACIEDKCFVLGYLQYCRYRASALKSTTTKPFSCTCTNNVVPEPQRTTKHPHCILDTTVDSSLVELDPKKLQLEDLGPSLSELQDVDPSLVFLCYRGFNHISGKLQTGKAMLATKA